jgi:hypothetical protein
MIDLLAVQAATNPQGGAGARIAGQRQVSELQTLGVPLLGQAVELLAGEDCKLVGLEAVERSSGGAVEDGREDAVPVDLKADARALLAGGCVDQLGRGVQLLRDLLQGSFNDEGGALLLAQGTGGVCNGQRRRPCRA